VTPSGVRAWVCRYQRAERLRNHGLGPTRIVSLAEARAKVRNVERLILDGCDPIEAARVKRTPSPKGETLGACAERYIAAHEAGWRNEKHRAQWRSTLATYVLPRIGETSVADVPTADVVRILEPIWRTRSETARRVGGRIETILDWATADINQTNFAFVVIIKAEVVRANNLVGRRAHDPYQTRATAGALQFRADKNGPFFQKVGYPSISRHYDLSISNPIRCLAPLVRVH
jgi:hypothetical protein